MPITPVPFLFDKNISFTNLIVKLTLENENHRKETLNHLKIYRK